MTLSPVFVVGSVRSGSTALVGALLASGFAGHREGHFHLIFPDLLNAAAKFYERRWRFAVPGNLLNEIPEPAFRGALLGFIRDYAAGIYEHRRWLEKTVNLESLHAVPIYREIWPDADFVYLKRHPLEILASRQVKFPQHSFEYHCRDLSEIFRAWYRLRADLPRYLEIEQRQMERAPDVAALRIGEFLKLPPEQVDLIARALGSTRPERTQSPVAREALLSGDHREVYEREFGPLQESGGFELFSG